MEDAARKEAPHIVLYIGSLQKGGAERVMGNLAEYFYAQGSGESIRIPRRIYLRAEDCITSRSVLTIFAVSGGAFHRI